LYEIISCQITGNKDIIVKTGYRSYELTADDINMAVDWMESIQKYIKDLKENKENVKKVAKKLTGEKKVLEKTSSQLQIEMREIKAAYEEERKMCEELQNVVRKSDNQIIEFREKIEKLGEENKLLASKIEFRDIRIQQLEQELEDKKNGIYTQTVSEAESDSKSDTETVRKLKQRWDADRTALRKAQAEIKEKNEEIAASATRLNIARRRIILLEKKVKDMTDILLKSTIVSYDDTL
jgi:chromosome segregation ATPase